MNGFLVFACCTLSFAQIAIAAVLGESATSGKEYRDKCEGKGTDQHWPCFQFKTGSLIDATFDNYDWQPPAPQSLLIKRNYAGKLPSESIARGDATNLYSFL